MSEMVERVARAMAHRQMIEVLRSGELAQYDKFDLAVAAVGGVDDLWPSLVGDARVAIEAMREPTEAMVEAVDNEDLMAWECFREDGSKWSVAEAFTAMIDAALAPKAQTP